MTRNQASTTLALAGFILGVLGGPAVADPAGDAAQGAGLFAQRCAMCHGRDATGGMGPSLHGVLGRKAASAAFPRYSAALKSTGLTWTRPKLDAYLTDPQKAAPGGQMMVQVADPAERRNLVAYLATLKP